MPLCLSSGRGEEEHTPTAARRSHWPFGDGGFGGPHRLRCSLQFDGRRTGLSRESRFEFKVHAAEARALNRRSTARGSSHAARRESFPARKKSYATRCCSRLLRLQALPDSDRDRTTLGQRARLSVP